MVATSLIPTVLALANFFASNFPNISWYPYWYLGNPYQYLIGPVVPVAFTLLSLFKLPLLEFYLLLIAGSFTAGGAGVYLLLKDWGVGKRQAILSAVLYLITPAGFYLLNFQNGLNHIAFGLLPFIFILYRKWLKKTRSKGTSALLISLSIAFALLINVSILLTLIIGFTALFIASDIKVNSEDKIIKTILMFMLAIFLSSIWYTPKFWWVLLANPSFGGVPLSNLITSFFKLLLNLLPLVLAVIFVKWRRYKFKGYLPFATLFFFSFLFLTVVRFLSDPDFVTDWIGFFLELQFGGAIILGWFFEKNIKLAVFLVLPVFITVLIIAQLLNCSIVTITVKQCNNDYQERILSLVKNNVKLDERIFLSGSSVFWVNASLPVQQVRGGVDQGSVHPYWAHGAYQIREGQDAELAYDWLTVLGASYILVHQNNSKDIFHDFRNTKRFFDQNYFNSIVEENGDQLYKVKGTGIARIADGKILKVPKPENGADKKVLSQYTSFLKKSLDFSFKKPNEIFIKGKFGQNEVVSLAVSYDSGWKLTKGQGGVLPDALGNMVIIPKKEGVYEFVLTFKKEGSLSWLAVFLSFILIVFIINYNRVFPKLKKKLPSLSLGTREDDY